MAYVLYVSRLHRQFALKVRMFPQPRSACGDQVGPESDIVRCFVREFDFSGRFRSAFHTERRYWDPLPAFPCVLCRGAANIQRLRLVFVSGGKNRLWGMDRVLDRQISPPKQKQFQCEAVRLSVENLDVENPFSIQRNFSVNTVQFPYVPIGQPCVPDAIINGVANHLLSMIYEKLSQFLASIIAIVLGFPSCKSA